MYKNRANGSDNLHRDINRATC